MDIDLETHLEKQEIIELRTFLQIYEKLREIGSIMFEKMKEKHQFDILYDPNASKSLSQSIRKQIVDLI